MRASIVAVTAGAIVLGACAGGTSGTPSDQGRRIEVEMKEFAYSQQALTLKAGEKVTLAFKNTGSIEHEFMAGRQAMAGQGYMEDMFKGVDHHITPESSADEGMGAMGGMGADAVGVRVAPGATATLTFVVPAAPGSYEFGCFVAGHYEAGMKGALSIQ